MDKRGNLQNVGYPVFFTPGAIAKLSFICDGEVTFQLKIVNHFNNLNTQNIRSIGKISASFTLRCNE